MKRVSELTAVLLTVLLIAQPMAVLAETSARLIPSDTVNVLDGTKAINRFHSEVPLPEGLLLECKGVCVVQSDGFQLVAHDKTVFALTESESQWDVAVKSGQIDFAVHPNAKQPEFLTPHDRIRIEQAIISAGSDRLIRGTLLVTESGTQITVHEGILRVMTQNGERLIRPESSLLLAQSTMVPGQTGEEDNRTDNATGLFWGSGSGGKGPLFVAGGGMVLVGGGLTAFMLLDDKDVSPSRP